jgi:peptide/nickel transport system substrate-binding protein
MTAGQDLNARSGTGGARVQRTIRTGAAAIAAMTALTVVAGAAGAQSSTPSPSPEPKTTFVVGVTGDLNSANPFRQFDTTEAFVGGLMYDGLIRLAQADYTPEPELADRWDVSDDQLTWTFHLRDGLTWSDGVPITAHDFAWTGNFVVEHDISSWSDGYTYTESIEAIDDQTIVWKTTRPTLVPGLPGYNLILPEHVWGDFTPKELKSFKNFPDPVISGSFNLVEWKQGEYFRMEANPDYWDGAPVIDEIVFRIYNSNEAVVQALIKGAIDFTQVPSAALFEVVEGRPNIGTAIDSAEGFYHVAFNLADASESEAHPAVRDQAFRWAVAHAMDKATLTERIARGYAEPGTTPVVPLYDFWHWEPPPGEAITFDLAEANRLLDEAGYLDTDGDGVRESPGGGEPLDLKLLTASTDADMFKTAPFIEGWLGEIGVDVTITTMTDAKLYDVWLESLDWDMIIYAWGVGPDPDFILSSFTTGQCGFWSDSCYSNPEYDRLYKTQQTTLDETERQSIVRQMQQILYHDVPEIVLWYPNSFEAWRSDRWTGFVRWPEPDGVSFWGNYYSARVVRPISDEAVVSQGEAGPAGWMWLVGLGVVALAIAAAAARRRRLDAFYA